MSCVSGSAGEQLHSSCCGLAEQIPRVATPAATHPCCTLTVTLAPATPEAGKYLASRTMAQSPTPLTASAELALQLPTTDPSSRPSGGLLLYWTNT
jgi:hypothetical protein